MVQAPRRSLGDNVVQLAVIAVLIGILVGSVILLRDYISSHNSSPPTSEPTYNFTCCTAFNPNVVYHPGEVVRLAWTPVEALPGDYPKRTITLTALLSTSYPSPAAIKSAVKSHSFSLTSGPFTAAAGQLHVSNRSGATPVMSIQIPGNAKTGYYDLVDTASQKGFSNTGAAIIKIRR
ncbi:MAG TPA: hypothetical protein VNT80_00675 [Acidimicrobiales bacterium]|jgi:hypothetical protein|nr:hypothetical protein [Acidimicrobiales bacterium]